MSVNGFHWRRGYGLLACIILTGLAQAKNFPQGPAIKPPSPPDDPAGVHAVEFTDDSVLHGTVQSLSPEEMLLFRTDMKDPIPFPTGTVTRIGFKAEADLTGGPHSTVQFHSGDWMAADVLMLRDGKAQLRISETQRLTVDQDRISFVCFAAGAAPDIFHGPESLEGWETNGAWTHDQGVLRCRQMGNLSRIIPVVADRMDLAFVMDKGEVQKNFMLSMMFNRDANEKESGPTNAWMQVRFNEGQLYLYAAAGDTNRNSSNTLPRAALKPAEDGKFHYRVMYDRIGGRIVVMVNGRKVAEQPTPPMPADTWQGQLTFQPMRWGSEADWAISNIHLTPWDGQVPTAAGGGTPEQLDSVTMNDGEVKIGRFESMQGTVVKFRSAAGSETLARQNIYLIRLHREAAPNLPAPAGPKVMLAQRGEIQLGSLRMGENGFTLGTTFAGEINLPRGALSAVVYPNKPQKDLPVADWLQFRNGDRLRGTLVAAGQTAELQWKLSTETLVELQTKHLNGARLAPRGEPRDPAPSGSCVAKFRNGDWLSGEMQALNAEHLRMTSLTGQEFTLPRPNIQALYLAANGQRPIWEGAAESTAWLQGVRGKVGEQVDGAAAAETNPGRTLSTHLDGAFLLSGKGGAPSGIGQIIEGAPERMELSFDTVSDHDALSLNVELFYDKDSNEGMLLRFWPGGLYLQDLGRGPRAGRGRQPVQLQWGEKVSRTSNRHHFQIFADRKKHQLQIFIDGIFIARHQQAEGEVREGMWGRGVALSCMAGQSHAPMLISQLWITPWNGRTPDSLEMAAGQSSLALANGDESAAPIVSATPEAFTLDFVGEPLVIPRSKVLAVNFGTPATTTEEVEALTLTSAALQPRLRLVTGGALTVEKLHLENNLVTGVNPSIGPLSLPLSALSEIVWRTLDRDVTPPQKSVKPRGPKRPDHD